MSIIVRKYPHISIENLIGNKTIYCPNKNNLVKTLTLLHNNTNIIKKII